nr:1-acyl-sn-glycerol-3-phosphate acyltransferase 2-like isoform X2 [Ipomoea batatas]
MWFFEYLFLERSWAKDENTLKSGLQQLRDYPLPFWLALFVEGTCFTQAKLLAAQEYATSTGLPVPRNVLIPRTKVLVLGQPGEEVSLQLILRVVVDVGLIVSIIFTSNFFILFLCIHFLLQMLMTQMCIV